VFDKVRLEARRSGVVEVNFAEGIEISRKGFGLVKFLGLVQNQTDDSNSCCANPLFTEMSHEAMTYLSLQPPLCQLQVQ